MPVLDPPPPLEPRRRERRAFTCRDAAGEIHRVRVLEASVLARPEQGWEACGPQLETDEGEPVVHVEGGLYRLWSAASVEWIEVVALGGGDAP